MNLPKAISQKSRRLLKEMLREDKVKRHLDKLKKHHPDSYHHSVRVGLMSIDLGYENRMEEDRIRRLGYGALLHDIGKLDVKKTILNKNGKLDEEESKIMGEHPRQGYQRLLAPEYEGIREIVAASHEHSAHPYPRKGNDRRMNDRAISERRKQVDSELAEIIAASDIWDALASKREYKEPVPPENLEAAMMEEYQGDRKYARQLMQKHGTVPEEGKQLWEILVPRCSNTGSEYSLKHHHKWDKNVRGIAKGLTILKPAKGHWVNPDGRVFVEQMIPVRVYCTKGQIEMIIGLTMDHYDQEAVMAYLVSKNVILRHRKH
jgi:HD superfamily phosphodiesterase